MRPGIYLPSNYDDYYASGGTTHSISSSSSASRLSGGEIFKFNFTNRSHENILSSLINSSSSSNYNSSVSHTSNNSSQVVYGVGSGGHVAHQYQQQTPNTPGTPGSYLFHLFFVIFPLGCVCFHKFYLKNKTTTFTVLPPHSPTPPLQRRLAKSFSVAPTMQTKGFYNIYLKFFLINCSKYCCLLHPFIWFEFFFRCCDGYHNR